VFGVSKCVLSTMMKYIATCLHMDQQGCQHASNVLCAFIICKLACLS
jgi:hypothetical protein